MNETRMTSCSTGALAARPGRLSSKKNQFYSGRQTTRKWKTGIRTRAHFSRQAWVVAFPAAVELTEADHRRHHMLALLHIWVRRFSVTGDF